MIPTSPPSLHVRIPAGELAAPGQGRPIAVAASELSFDPPELRDFKAVDDAGHVPAAPPDSQPDRAAWNSWPGKGLIHLSPRYQDGTHILGGLFRAFREDSLRVTTADGQTVYQRDRDFIYDPDWGVVANKDAHLQGPVLVQARGALQRLELIQVSAADGSVSVKKGQPLMVSPALFDPDPGFIALAGGWRSSAHTWKRSWTKSTRQEARRCS